MHHRDQMVVTLLANSTCTNFGKRANAQAELPPTTLARAMIAHGA